MDRLIIRIIFNPLILFLIGFIVISIRFPAMSYMLRLICVLIGILVFLCIFKATKFLLMKLKIRQ